MYTNRRSVSRAGNRSPSAAQVEQVVQAAEDIVLRARAIELVRHRDYRALGLRTAHAECEGAYRSLALAQADGDPQRIVAAQAALEQALRNTRRSTIALDQVCTVLQEELLQLSRATARASARTAKTHAVTDLVRQLEYDAPTIVEAASGAAAGLPGPARRPKPTRRWWHRFLVRRRVGMHPLSVK